MEDEKKEMKESNEISVQQEVNEVFFLPGSWHGSWCFEKITEIITSLNQNKQNNTINLKYTTIDYPVYDQINKKKIKYFQQYIDYCEQIIENKNEQNKHYKIINNIICAHSMGGQITTQLI